jgi:hypothetical protein
VVAAASPSRDRLCTYTVRSWVGRRQQPELPGVPVWRFPLFCRFPREEHLFPQQKVVGRDSFLEHQPDHLGRLTARGLLYECVFVTPSFFRVASTYWKHLSGMYLLDLPLVGASTFLEVVVASPYPIQDEDSSGSHGALSSLHVPGSMLQRLDVRLRLCPR